VVLESFKGERPQQAIRILNIHHCWLRYDADASLRRKLRRAADRSSTGCLDLGQALCISQETQDLIINDEEWNEYYKKSILPSPADALVTAIETSQAPDEDGRPLFIFSGMSSHTQDILADPRCSLTVTAKEFKGGRRRWTRQFDWMGTCTHVTDNYKMAKAKEIYFQKYPGVFWVDFGEFS
jgi:hypothetical protein